MINRFKIPFSKTRRLYTCFHHVDKFFDNAYFRRNIRFEFRPLNGKFPFKFGNNFATIGCSAVAQLLKISADVVHIGYRRIRFFDTGCLRKYLMFYFFNMFINFILFKIYGFVGFESVVSGWKFW